MSFAVFAGLACAETANAQWARQTTFDVGAMRLTRDDFADTGGITAAALWGRWSDRVSLIGSGAVTRITDGRATGVGLGSASYSVPIRHARIEAGGTGTILGTSNQGPTSSWLGFARAHWLGDRWGTWIGAGGGDVHVSATTFGAGTGELGAWLRRGDQRLTLNATTVRTSLLSTVIFSDETVLRVREPVRYADVALSGHGAWRRFEVDAAAITRHAWKGELASTPTGALSVAWWATPYIAIAGALGRQLSDPWYGSDSLCDGRVALFGRAAWACAGGASATVGAGGRGIADRRTQWRRKNARAGAGSRRRSRGSHGRRDRLGGDRTGASRRSVGGAPNDVSRFASRRGASRWRHLGRAGEPGSNRRRIGWAGRSDCTPLTRPQGDQRASRARAHV